MASGRQAILVSRPEGMVRREDFEFRDAPVPEPEEGTFVVRVEAVSIDPAMRGWMAAGKSYVPPVGLGEVMRALAGGRVEASRHPDFREGDAVIGQFGVQTHALSDGQGVTRVDTALAPIERWIGGLGMPGLTAYFGLLEEGRPAEGETVLVSAASGAVGSVVGQIAKIRGCRAVGVAGGPEKCATLTDELGFDAACDYKAGDLHAQLKDACPDGVDVLFENVGGAVFDAEIMHMNRRGRVVLCGLISDYNATGGVHGLRNVRSVLVNRLTMQGIIVFDYRDRYPDAVRQLAQWHAEGRLKLREDVRDGGVDAYVDVLNLLYTGGNDGKLVLRL